MAPSLTSARASGPIDSQSSPALPPNRAAGVPVQRFPCHWCFSLRPLLVLVASACRLARLRPAGAVWCQVFGQSKLSCNLSISRRRLTLVSLHMGESRKQGERLLAPPSRSSDWPGGSRSKDVTFANQALNVQSSALAALDIFLVFAKLADGSRCRKGLLDVETRLPWKVKPGPSRF